MPRLPRRAAPVAALRRVPLLVLTAAAVAAGSLPGCVERKLVFRSKPEGALLTISDLPAPAPTPVEVPAIWDGTRRVQLTAPGYRTLDATADVKSRWHDYFPLDVFAEFVWPGTLSDVQEFEYTLEPWHPLTKRLTPDQEREIAAKFAEFRARADAARAGGADGIPGEPGAQAPAPSDEPPPPPPPAPRGPSGPEAPLPPAPRAR